MSDTATPERRDARFGELLRIAAWIVVLTGAAGSMYFMRQVGHRTPTFLLILFIGWVLAPFAGLLAADYRSKRWPAATRTTLYGLMLVLPPASAGIYGYVARTGPAKPAAAFLMVPLASWVMMLAAVGIAARVARRQN